MSTPVARAIDGCRGRGDIIAGLFLDLDVEEDTVLM
jgi:hypothetical protein